MGLDRGEGGTIESKRDGSIVKLRTVVPAFW